MQVQSLLLELQYSKWESSQKNSLFRWDRSKTEMHREKECGCHPSDEELSKEVVKSFI